MGTSFEEGGGSGITKLRERRQTPVEMRPPARGFGFKAGQAQSERVAGSVGFQNPGRELREPLFDTGEMRDIIVLQP